VSIKVRYITEPDWERRLGLVARSVEQEFSTIDEAKAAPFPTESVFAIIRLEGGYHSCIKGSLWEYHDGDLLGVVVPTRSDSYPVLRYFFVSSSLDSSPG